jgi:hypothetical protein
MKARMTVDRLDAIAREIEAALKKADKAHARSNDLIVSVDRLIAEGARLCDRLGVSFNKWLKEKCPNVGKSRAYEQRAIALGLKDRRRSPGRHAQAIGKTHRQVFR